MSRSSRERPSETEAAEAGCIVAQGQGLSLEGGTGRRFLAGTLAIAGLYWGVSHINYLLFREGGVLPMPLWPAAALAITAAIMYGWRAAPGLALGTILANHLSLGASLPLAAGIAVMNTLGPITGAALLRRNVARIPPFHNLRDMLLFLAFGVALMAALTATGGVATKWLVGLAPTQQLPLLWLQWWLAHASGALLFAPALFGWVYDQERLSRRDRLSMLAVSLATVFVTLLMFFPLQIPSLPVNGTPFLLIVPMVWVAIRFPMRHTMTLFAAVVLSALFGTIVLDANPFGTLNPIVSFGLMSTGFSLTLLTVSALMQERRKAEQDRETTFRQLFETQKALWDQHNELARNRDKLAQTEEQYKNILEMSPLGFHSYELRADGALIFTGANPAADALLKIRNAQFVGKEIVEAFPALAETEIPARYRQVAAEGGSWHADQVFYERGEIRGAYSVTAFHTGPNTMAAVFFDITERRQAEEALRDNAAKLQLLIDNAHDMISRHAPDGTILFASPACEAIFGYTPDELVGKSPREFVTSEEYDGTWRAINDAVEHKLDIYRVEHGMHRKDGRYIWVETLGRMSYAPDGTVREIQCAVRDITERRRAEEELQASRQRLRLHFEHTPLAIIEWDLDLRVCEWNPAAERIFGYSREEALGTHVSFIVAEPARAHVDATWNDVLSQRGGSRTSDMNVTKDGRTILCEWFNTPLVDGNGAVIGVASLILDITERVNAEEERKEMERRIQHAQKLESLGVLAGGIAHDFNNILMAVLGHADLALEHIPAASLARESLEEIGHAARRAADLCRQMLAYSGKGKFVIESIDLNEIVTEMAHLLRTSISKKATLNLQLGKGPGERNGSPYIEGDATQIRQVVLNLITNASEAIGDRPGTITLTTGTMHCTRAYLAGIALEEELREGSYAYFEVADTGCGMSEETLAHIFDPFFTTKFAGRGLGMPAVLGIVHSHNGAIDIRSEEDVGSTLRVLFPAIEAHRESVAAGPSTAGTHKRAEGRVLLVDDEESLRMLGRKMIEAIGFEVETAADGDEALRIYEERGKDIDIVLLDLTMPRMDGEETFRALREANPNVRVVLCSGYTEQEITARFAGRGIAGFLEKPYSLGILREKLQAVLSNEFEAGGSV